MPKKVEEISESRERVLDTAEVLFMERGFASVTMRDIADKLGVRQAALYYHAPDGKAQLFREVVARNLHRQREGMVHAIATAGPSLEEQLGAVARWLVAQLPIDMMRMLRSDAAHISDSYAHELLAEVSAAIMQPITRIIRDAQERGEIRDLDPNGFAGMLIAIMNWTGFLDRQFDFGVSADDMINDALSILLHGIKTRRE